MWTTNNNVWFYFQSLHCARFFYWRHPPPRNLYPFYNLLRSQLWRQTLIPPEAQGENQLGQTSQLLISQPSIGKHWKHSLTLSTWKMIILEIVMMRQTRFHPLGLRDHAEVWKPTCLSPLVAQLIIPGLTSTEQLFYQPQEPIPVLRPIRSSPSWLFLIVKNPHCRWVWLTPVWKRMMPSKITWVNKIDNSFDTTWITIDNTYQSNKIFAGIHRHITLQSHKSTVRKPRWKELIYLCPIITPSFSSNGLQQTFIALS